MSSSSFSPVGGNSQQLGQVLTKENDNIPKERNAVVQFAIGTVSATGTLIGNTAQRVVDGFLGVAAGRQDIQQKFTHVVDQTKEFVSSAMEMVDRVTNPIHTLDSTLEKIKAYDEHNAEMQMKSPINEYPESKEGFSLDHCQNYHTHSGFFRTWVANKQGPSLQKIDHLLSHSILENQSKLIAHVLEKFPNDDQAVINSLEAMIKALSVPQADWPRTIEIPTQRTAAHSGKVVINGILTSTEEVLMRAIDEYGNHNGQQVTMVCIPSEGFFADALNTWNEKNGGVTLASYVAYNAIQGVLQDYPHKPVLVQAFSRGSAVFDSLSHYLLPEQCQRVAIHTFGATEFVKIEREDGKKFLDARNYVSWKDPVSMPQYAYRFRQHSSEAAQVKARLHELRGIHSDLPVKIEYVETDGSFGIDHDYDNTYFEARNASYNLFKDRYDN